MGDAPVLVIDEAQTSPLRTLRRLNVLLNLELDGCKLLQVVLAGQPELDERLLRPELWQLQQRIILRTRLMPLSMEETAEYVRGRLEKGGAKEEVFCEEALKAVHTGARGIPRLTNLLCEHALIAAYSDKLKPITAKIVREVAADFDLSVQTGMPAEEEMKLRAEWVAPARIEEASSAAPRSDTTVAKEISVEVNQKISLPMPSPSTWPIQVQNTEGRDGTASARATEKMAPIAVVEDGSPTARPAEIATKSPDVVAVAAGGSTVLTAAAVDSANVQAAVAVANSTAAARMASAVPEAAPQPLEVPSTAGGVSVPLAMAASAATLSATPALAPEPVKEGAQATPAAVKATTSVQRAAKPEATGEATKAAIGQAMLRAVVVKPLAPKPTLVKPIQKITPKVAKPKSVPIRWKPPTFVESCLRYCHAVGKSFAADWRQFMQAPIQPRKQTGAGTGNS